MSLSKFSPSIDRDDNTDDESGEFFPLLSLPTELISHVLSFLPIKDRLNARVNKRLNVIELKSKYYVKALILDEYNAIKDWMKTMKDAFDDEDNSVDKEDEKRKENGQRITYFKEKPYSIECLKRIAQNISLGYLYVEVDGSEEFHREIYNLIKEFDIDTLVLIYKDNSMMVDSFLLDLTRVCMGLVVSDCRNITTEALHQLYKNVIDYATKSLSVLVGINMDQCISFLNVIGITHNDGRFYSNRDIQIYEKKQYDVVINYIFFDGFLEINIIYCRFEDFRIRGLVFWWHETQESLEEAKNKEGLIRMENCC